MNTPPTDREQAALLARCRAAATGCAGFVALVALATFVGWQFDLPVLRSVVPGLVAMNPLTATCFLLSAVAVLLTRHDAAHPRARSVARACAAVVTACGVLCLGRYVTGASISIDQVLFARKLATAGPAPNRMAPNTALLFVLLGAALLCVRVELRRGVRPAQFLALGVAFTAFVALVGYAYSVASLIRLAACLPMAVHTAVCFVVIAAGVLLVVPERGLMARVVGGGPGGRLIRRLVPAYVLVPPLLGWLRLQGELLGWYDSAVGTAMMVGVLVVLGVALSWGNAVALDRTDEARRRAAEITHQLAYYDPLTGLPTRTLFLDRLAQALAGARRRGGEVAVLFVDLDGFKQVNDRLGHAAGDALLAMAAQRLAGALRVTDTAARLGGDEFTVILTDVRGPAGAEVVASRLLQALGRPYDLPAGQAIVSASVGMSRWPHDGDEGTVLIRKADAAMYAAKRAGKNRFQRYREPAAESAAAQGA